MAHQSKIPKDGERLVWNGRCPDCRMEVTLVSPDGIRKYAQKMFEIPCPNMETTDDWVTMRLVE